MVGSDTGRKKNQKKKEEKSLFLSLTLQHSLDELHELLQLLLCAYQRQVFSQLQSRLEGGIQSLEQMQLCAFQSGSSSFVFALPCQPLAALSKLFLQRKRPGTRTREELRIAKQTLKNKEKEKENWKERISHPCAHHRITTCIIDASLHVFELANVPICNQRHTNMAPNLANEIPIRIPHIVSFSSSLKI